MACSILFLGFMGIYKLVSNIFLAMGHPLYFTDRTQYNSSCYGGNSISFGFYFSRNRTTKVKKKERSKSFDTRKEKRTLNSVMIHGSLKNK
jgi:hypothetical protein